MSTETALEQGIHEISEESLIASIDVELSDLDLLSAALQDALDARRAGLIVGLGVDEVALRRAQRRAWRSDVARLLRIVGRGGAA